MDYKNAAVFCYSFISPNIARREGFKHEHQVALGRNRRAMVSVWHVASRSVFLEHGADVNLQSSDGQTALHKALETDHTDEIFIVISLTSDDISSFRMFLLYDR
jgi:ankyrin repeat protein